VRCGVSCGVGGESFAGRDAEVLNAREQRALLEPVVELATLLKAAAKKKGATLLASDVKGLVARAAALAAPPRKGAPPAAESMPTERKRSVPGARGARCNARGADWSFVCAPRRATAYPSHAGGRRSAGAPRGSA
jgi:hypothetical protein